MPDRAETTVEGMQVCRNGHVITERLTSHPEQGRSHCEQCGSVTLDGCPTCGRRFVGADHVPGLIVVGSRPAPLNCTACGAPFPWAAVASVEPSSLAELATFLRRLPATIRSLRSRRGTQPPYRI